MGRCKLNLHHVTNTNFYISIYSIYSRTDTETCLYTVDTEACVENFTLSTSDLDSVQTAVRPLVNNRQVRDSHPARAAALVPAAERARGSE